MNLGTEHGSHATALVLGPEGAQDYFSRHILGAAIHVGIPAVGGGKEKSRREWHGPDGRVGDRRGKVREGGARHHEPHAEDHRMADPAC